MDLFFKVDGVGTVTGLAVTVGCDVSVEAVAPAAGVVVAVAAEVAAVVVAKTKLVDCSISI